MQRTALRAAADADRLTPPCTRSVTDLRTAPVRRVRAKCDEALRTRKLDAFQNFRVVF